MLAPEAGTGDSDGGGALAGRIEIGLDQRKIFALLG